MFGRVGMSAARCWDAWPWCGAGRPVARGFFQEVLVRRSTHGLLSVRDNLPTSGSGAGHIPAQHLGSL